MGSHTGGGNQGSGCLMDRPPLTSLSGPLRAALTRLGLTNIDVLFRLIRDWDSIVDPPWEGASSPIMLEDHELTVQASSLAAVGILRYATSDLVVTINASLEEEVIQVVRVVGPPR